MAASLGLRLEATPALQDILRSAACNEKLSKVGVGGVLHRPRRVQFANCPGLYVAGGTQPSGSACQGAEPALEKLAAYLHRP